MMIRVRNTLAIFAFTALFGCAVEAPASTPTTEQVNLSLYTTHATQPLTRDLVHHYTDTHPEFTIELSDNSYTSLITELQQGSIDYFVSTYVPANQDIWAAPLARDGLALIVHPENPISNLQIDAIRDIFSGHVKEWQSENNNESLIVPLTYQDNNDIYHEFHRLVMGRNRITSNAQVVPNIEAMIQQVSETRQAIGYIPLSRVSNAINTLSIDGVSANQTNMLDNVYPLRTTVFIIGREDPPPEYRIFLQWVQSEAGQDVVAEDYVPLP